MVPYRKQGVYLGATLQEIKRLFGCYLVEKKNTHTLNWVLPNRY